MSSPTERWLQLLASPNSSFSSKKEASQRLENVLKLHAETSASIIHQICWLLVNGTNDTKVCTESFILRSLLKELSSLLVSPSCDWFQNEVAFSLPPINLIGRNRKTLNQFLLDNDFLTSKPIAANNCTQVPSTQFSCDDLLGLPLGVVQTPECDWEDGVAGVKKELDVKEDYGEEEPPAKVARLQNGKSEQSVKIKKENMQKDAEEYASDIKEETKQENGLVLGIQTYKTSEKLDIWKYLIEKDIKKASDSVSISPISELVSTLINIFVLFFNKLNSQDWEERHGAAMGVNCFVQSLPEALLTDSVVEVVLDKALKVLALDRLSDFVDDETVFPVREVLAQLIVFLFQCRSDVEDQNFIVQKIILEFLKEYEWNVVIGGLLLLIASRKTELFDELFDKEELGVFADGILRLADRFSLDSDIIRLSSKFFIGVYSNLVALDRKKVYHTFIRKILNTATVETETSNSSVDTISSDTFDLFVMCLADSAIVNELHRKPRVWQTCFSTFGGEALGRWKRDIKMFKNCCWLKLFNCVALDTSEFMQCISTLCRLPLKDMNFSYRGDCDYDYYRAALLFCTKHPSKGANELSQINRLLDFLLPVQRPALVYEKLMKVLSFAATKKAEFDYTAEVGDSSVTLTLLPEKENPAAYNELIWALSKLILLQADVIQVLTTFLESTAFMNRKIALLSILKNHSKVSNNNESVNSLTNLITPIIEQSNFVFQELRESFDNLQSTIGELDPGSSEDQSGENLGAKIAKFVSRQDSLSETAREALDRLKTTYDEYEKQEKECLIDIKALSACCLIALERYPEKISPIVNSLMAGLKFSNNPGYLSLLKESVKSLCVKKKLTPKACEKFVECLLTFIGEKAQLKDSFIEGFSNGSPGTETNVDEKIHQSKLILSHSANIETIVGVLCSNKSILGLIAKLDEVLKFLDEKSDSNLLKFCFFCRYASVKLPDEFVAHCLQTVANVATKNEPSKKTFALCVAMFAEAAFNKNLSKQLFHFVFVKLLKRSFSDQSEKNVVKQFVLDLILMIAVEEDKTASLDDAVISDVIITSNAVHKKKLDSYYKVLMLTPVLQSVSHHNLAIRRTAARSFGLVLPQAVIAIDSEDINTGKAKKGSRSVDEMKEDLKSEYETSAQFLSKLLNNQAFRDCCIPDCIRASLRPYQKEGVAWLQFLRNYNLGGILADDMGLGKTLTCVCLLADQMLKNKQVSLVVCPKSLIYHWKTEIQSFCPDLSSFCIDSKSAISDAPNDVAVFITSYDIIRMSCDAFAEKYTFDYVILDEGHVIKNVKSKLFQAVQKLKANHRLVLTGTPIQNDVCELWTLFEFLIPSYLGSMNQFRGTFANPVKASNIGNKTSVKNLEKCSKALKLLHSKVLPLILRREKENVLKDLPPKTIQDISCDMSPQQKKLYIEIEKKFESCNSEKTSALKLFQLLLKICNKPSAVDSSKAYPSGKIEALKDLLNSIFPQSSEDSSGAEMNCIPHRALVFFQTRSMLEFVVSEICENVDWKHLSYLVLSGKLGATDRMKVVKKFNSDPFVNLLLCTTAVGGVGLNLTGADIVIFVEHDFNPVKDLQAMDRAHRIGQRRPVNVYRLITRDSVEENIMNVQKFKTALAKAVVNEDNTGIQSMDTSSILDSFLSVSNSGDDGTKNSQQGTRNSLSGLLSELDHLWTPLRKLDDAL